MKLVRWPIAAATAYAVYKYTIGRKAKGEAVFATLDEENPEKTPPRPASATKPKRVRKPRG